MLATKYSVTIESNIKLIIATEYSVTLLMEFNYCNLICDWIFTSTWWYKKTYLQAERSCMPQTLQVYQNVQ